MRLRSDLEIEANLFELAINGIVRGTRTGRLAIPIPVDGQMQENRWYRSARGALDRSDVGSATLPWSDIDIELH